MSNNKKRIRYMEGHKARVIHTSFNLSNQANDKVSYLVDLSRSHYTMLT